MLKYGGPDAEGGRAERFSEDTIKWTVLSGSRKTRARPKFQYNELGHVSQFTGKSGMEVHYLEDALGRRVGQAFTIDATH